MTDWCRCGRPMGYHQKSCQVVRLMWDLPLIAHLPGSPRKEFPEILKFVEKARDLAKRELIVDRFQMDGYDIAIPDELVELSSFDGRQNRRWFEGTETEILEEIAVISPDYLHKITLADFQESLSKSRQFVKDREKARLIEEKEDRRKGLESRAKIAADKVYHETLAKLKAEAS